MVWCSSKRAEFSPSEAVQSQITWRVIFILIVVMLNSHSSPQAYMYLLKLHIKLKNSMYSKHDFRFKSGLPSALCYVLMQFKLD